MHWLSLPQKSIFNQNANVMFGNYGFAIVHNYCNATQVLNYVQFMIHYFRFGHFYQINVLNIKLMSIQKGIQSKESIPLIKKLEFIH